MTVEFNIKDFCYPISILKLRNFFEESQWYPLEKLIAYQEQRLKEIITHAYDNVPYYRDLFSNLKLAPDDFNKLSDLQKIPILSKTDLRNNFERLQAKNKNKYHPKILHTSGTSGECVSFLVDKPSNVLEFVYYWRYWNWAGYHLGDRFAEFTSYYFMKQKDSSSAFYSFQKLSNRLLLNSLSISLENIDSYVKAIKTFKPLFLKGLPSVLYYFALFLREKGVSDINFKAIFSTGEVLLDNQRKFIEEAFNSRVFDSYGHMERTVAISECQNGSMHINPEYGILEMVDKMPLEQGVTFTAKIIGSSLHNFSMPLLRYEVGDLVEVEEGKQCKCGRQMPLVNRINGRHEDVIVTPDGKVVTALFIVLDEVPGISMGQIIQKTIDELVVKIVRTQDFTDDSELMLISYIRKFVGLIMKIKIEYVDRETLKREVNGKFRTVVSNVAKEYLS